MPGRNFFRPTPPPSHSAPHRDAHGVGRGNFQGYLQSTRRTPLLDEHTAAGSFPPPNVINQLHAGDEPVDHEDHFGTGGVIEVLKFPDGTAVGRSDGVFSGRPVTDPKQVRILELRYGLIRAQALTPRESRGFIELLLGET